MLHLTVLAVGKLKERYWQEACAEYAKRLAPYVHLKLIEVADLDPARNGGEARARAAEGEALLRRLPPQAWGVALDTHGRETSSEGLAGLLRESGLNGRTHLAFCIGGSTGLSDAVKERASMLMSFGPITLPHNLARVVLLEQLYRACKINAGETYHK
jgi:23S rRNA (pseudouridine1915-N3)-methyltransferase